MNSEEVIFGIDELCIYLRIKPITLYKMASSGRIPAFKVGSLWRFRKATIDEWIEKQERARR